MAREGGYPKLGSAIIDLEASSPGSLRSSRRRLSLTLRRRASARLV